MTLSIERTVRERNQDGALSEPKVLANYQDLQAWVLLGDPGAGKTNTFESLAQAAGGEYIKVGDFLDLAPRGGYRAPLFIDGLDEASALGGRAPLGRIRQKLGELGTPSFRISCREADWRGNTDSQALQQLVGADQFAELHLAPLDAAQILAFAAYWLKGSKAQAQAFVTEAHRRNLDGLLSNPQTLHMLIEAVGPEGWPNSKAQTYAKACEKLVREQNEEHLAAQRDTSFTDAQLLHAASYLSAVMLLSGSASIALQRQKQPLPHVVEINMLTTDSPETPSLNSCRAALHTSLFKGDGTGNVTPVHRTVAEYLGATYLAERIRAHLPANRVLSLIQGEDGGVVPELRGLHAWLAVVANDSVRSTLIDHDPLGLVLHGDVQFFSVDEKVHLLNALLSEATRYTHFRSQNWASHPFGALATLDMEETFGKWLQSPERTPAHQAVLNCVLDAMEHGQYMPALASELEKIVKDKTYWPGLRRNALNTLLVYAKKTNDLTAPQRLLQAVHHGDIEDSDNDLLGTLLRQLYPLAIAAKDLWRYYKPSSQTYINQHWEFWRYLATCYAPREDIPVLLDALLATNIRLHSKPDEHHLTEIFGDLLCEAIVYFGENCTIERLYAWFTLSIGAYSDNNLSSDKKNKLGQWLTEHPDIYKNLVGYGILKFERSDQPEHIWLYEIKNMLCQAAPPIDAANWYLTLAEARNDSFRPQLLRESFSITKQRNGDDASLELLSQWMEKHPEDAEWITQGWLSCPYPPDEQHQDLIKKQAEREKQRTEEEKEKLEFLRGALPKLTGEDAHIGLLDHVGDVYLNFFHNSTAKTPYERLLETLNNDPHWVEMALAGLRQCLRRKDLPTVTEILALHLKSHRYNIAVACLAAVELLYDEAPSTLLDLSDSLLEKVIAFRLTNNYGNTPAWFLHLVQQKPVTVASIMQKLMLQQIEKKAAQVEGLYALAHDANYAHIAQLITPTLIQALPAKATKKQLNTVEELIICLLRFLDQVPKLELIKQQFAKPNMDVAQHVYWLTAGVQVAPAIYLTRLKEYLGINQSRTSHAYDLLRGQRNEHEGLEKLTLEAKVFFIELLGARFTPSEERNSGQVYWVTPAMDSMRFVQQLIASIAADPSDTASQSLRKLVQAPLLKPWSEALQQAIYEQQIVRRKALFKPASISEVCKTLANLQPANAADLHALVVDHLTELANKIRHDSTNDYRQYWDGERPKIENDCRDTLLSDLKIRLLALGINAEPEGHYANQKRADIKVIYGAFQIPIEIKRDSHKDIWKAIHQQLITKYSREHASDGYGIYIVFWFDKDPMPVACDGGNKPKTPQELQLRLAATIPKELKNKITVLVIDCSKPLKK